MAGSADGRRREATRTRRRTLRLAVPRRTRRCGARRLPGLGTGEGQRREREPGSPWRHRFALRCRRKRLCCALASAGTGDFLHRPVAGATLGRPCVWKAGEAPACGRQGRRQAGPRRLLAAAGSAGAGPSVLVLRVQALLSAPQLITICKELRIKGKSEKSASSGSSRTVSSLTT